MESITIDLRPQVRQYNGFGREVLADVHFRTDIPEYDRYLSSYTQENREASDMAVAAFDKEVVQVLLADGWTLRREKYGPGDCPELRKGAQYLYCHPHDISGEVLTSDVERLETMFNNLTTCKYRWTDNYGDVIVTTSEEDESKLYHETYPDGLAAILQEALTTKRSNLYKDKGSAEHYVAGKITIKNTRSDLDEMGCGSPHMRSALMNFVQDEYNRLLDAGYIRETTLPHGQRLARWATKAEQKKIK